MKFLKIRQLPAFILFLLLANNGYSQEPLKNLKIVNYENNEISINLPDYFNVAARDNFSPIKIPLYKFKDDAGGKFLRQFSDSLVNYFPYLIQSVQLYPVETNREAVIQAQIVFPRKIKKATGVIIFNEYKICLLFSNNASWLNEFCIEETDTLVNVDCNIKYLPEEKRNGSFLITDGIYARIESVSTNAYDITHLYIPDDNSAKAQRLLDWVEQFSLKYNLPIGFSYINQKPWHEESHRLFN